MQQFTLEQFRATFESGGVVGVTLKAQGAAFSIQAETRRGGDAVLVDTRRKQPRMFIDPKKAMLLLRDIGVRNAKLDTQSWNPEQADVLRKPRPAAAAQMKAAHEAAAYDKWFRAQVQEAIDDPRPGIPHELVKAEWAIERAELMKQVAEAA
jgi:hypothetical protein